MERSYLVSGAIQDELKTTPITIGIFSDPDLAKYAMKQFMEKHGCNGLYINKAGSLLQYRLRVTPLEPNKIEIPVEFL